MPEDPNLTDEAHRVATELVDAAEAFTKAVPTLAADSVRLGLDAAQAALNKLKDIVRAAGGSK